MGSAFGPVRHGSGYNRDEVGLTGYDKSQLGARVGDETAHAKQYG